MTFLHDATFDLGGAKTVLPVMAAIVVALAWVRVKCGSPLTRSRHWAVRACRIGVVAVLAVLVLNPVHVAVIPAPMHRPEVHILLDASQSMQLGTPESRWQEASSLLRAALAEHDGRADVRIHRFGERLAFVDVEAFRAGKDVPPPADADSQLAAAFRQLSGRIGREPPAGLVVVSDGRVRDPDKLDEMVAPWRKLHVPIHVVPVGRPAEGGDVAIVAAVAPARARKQSQVSVDVFLRSFGFAGQRVELQLQALGDNGSFRRVLSTLPVTLHDGVQPVTMAFRVDPELKRMKLHVTAPPGDLSAANNDFPLEIELDRTKIRVLLLDGSADGSARPGRIITEIGEDADAPYAPVRDALLADPDVQCTVYQVTAGGIPRRVLTRETSHLGPAFIKTAAELLAYDAIVLSNVPHEALSEVVLEWIEEWIGKRGGGLLMAGGPRSFGGGEWSGTAVERMLPVEFLSTSDWEAVPVVLEPTGADLHPVWRLFEDERATRSALRTLPESLGHNAWVRVKPQSGSVLGAQKAGTGSGTAPLFAVGAYGRGRTAALAVPLTAAWSPGFTRQWGEGGDNRHFAKFVRNAVYWLTEDSAIGRRRLVASTDKRYYRPGEMVSLLGQTFDESANRTGRYRVVAILEPKQLEGSDLPPSPVKWPAGRPRAPGESGPLAGWGEEIELQLDPQTKDYHLALPLAEMLANGASGAAFKLELTAYEGQTQIDSSSLDVQILSDPFEQQNPLPNREFLSGLAQAAGGREITDAAGLAAVLNGAPIEEGPHSVRHTPLCSREWLLGGLIALVAIEWFLRRWLGLA